MSKKEYKDNKKEYKDNNVKFCARHSIAAEPGVPGVIPISVCCKSKTRVQNMRTETGPVFQRSKHSDRLCLVWYMVRLWSGGNWQLELHMILQ